MAYNLSDVKGFLNLGNKNWYIFDLAPCPFPSLACTVGILLPCGEEAQYILQGEAMWKAKRKGNEISQTRCVSVILGLQLFLQTNLQIKCVAHNQRQAD